MLLDACINRINNFITSSSVSQPLIVNVNNSSQFNELISHFNVGDNRIISSKDYCKNDEMPQVKSVTNNMVHTSMGQAVADWILSRCQNRITYHTDERGNPAVALTDTVKIYDYFGVNRNAVVVRQSFGYDGGLSVQSEAIINGT